MSKWNVLQIFCICRLFCMWDVVWDSYMFSWIILWISSLIFYLDWMFRFVSSVLPPGGEELKGDEVDTIINFKKALGIEDPDAAAMHMEVRLTFYCWYLFQSLRMLKGFVWTRFQLLLGLMLLVTLQIGRRIFRLRLETGDRDAGIEERRVGHMC